MKLEWESLEEDPRENIWESWPGAVLLDDEIKYYATRLEYPLIKPFDEANLKPARYQLTLGSEAKVGGKTVRIDEKNPLRIDPHQVAIVRTYETLNLPRFLIGRWNLTVEAVYKGLLWVGAGQVDPGWVGYLPCPLYNLSNDPVVLQQGEKLFTIDFVRTTRFDTSVNISYPNKSPEPPTNPSIGYYDQYRIRSAPYEALQDLKELRTFRNIGYAAVTLIMLVLTLMVGALAVVAVQQPLKPGDSSSWYVAGFWGIAFISILSVFISCFTLWKLRKFL